VKRKVRQEGGAHSDGSKVSNGSNARFTSPLYREILEFMVNDGGHSLTRKKFAQKYGMCYYGLNLKQVRVLRDCTKEDVVKVFGLI
jgi:hypothetical protein